MLDKIFKTIVLPNVSVAEIVLLIWAIELIRAVLGRASFLRVVSSWLPNPESELQFYAFKLAILVGYIAAATLLIFFAKLILGRFTKKDNREETAKPKSIDRLLAQLFPNSNLARKVNQRVVKDAHQKALQEDDPQVFFDAVQKFGHGKTLELLNEAQGVDLTTISRDAGQAIEYEIKEETRIAQSRKFLSNNSFNYSQLNDVLGELPWSIIKEKIKEEIRHAIIFKPVYPPSFDTVPTSYFGGLPMASEDLDWPSYKENGQTVYCRFIGQIDCSNFPKFGENAVLPETGILYFFAPLVDRGLLAEISKETQLVIFKENHRDLKPIHPPGIIGENIFVDSGFQTTWEWEQQFVSQPRNSISPLWEMHPIGTTQTFLTGELAQLLSEIEGANELAKSNGEQDAELWTETQIQDLNSKLCSDHFRAQPPSREEFVSFNHKQMSGYTEFPQNWLGIETAIGFLETGLQNHPYSRESLLKILEAPSLDAEKYNDPEDYQNRLVNQKEQKDRIQKRIEELPKILSLIEVWKKHIQNKQLSNFCSDAEKTAFNETWSVFDAFEKNYFVGSNQAYGHSQPADQQSREEIVAKSLERAKLHSIKNALVASKETFEALPKEIIEIWKNAFEENPYGPDYYGQYQIHRQHQSFGYPARTQGLGDPPEMIGLINLFQIQNDPRISFDIGSYQSLQYWIWPEDLIAKRFDKAFATLG